MKNVCFLSGDITRCGGTEKVACQIMTGLAKQFNISVVSLVEDSREMFYSLPKEIEHTALFDINPDGMKQYSAIVQKIRKYLKEKDIHILIDIDTILDMFSVPAVRFTKTKLISWEHFNFYESMGNSLRIPIRKYISRFSDCIVTLTQEDQENFQTYFGKRHRIEQIYNPIEFEVEEHQYSDNSKTIISVGRLVKQKGFDYLVDVAELVFKKHSEWQWLILGEGYERKLLETKIAEKKITQVKLVGRVSNVGHYLRKAAIFVLTSRNEGFPLVLIEAKANRLPVVSFDCRTGPSEMITDNVNGFLVKCYDVKMMADKVCELIDSKEKRRYFSGNALLDTEKMKYDTIIKQWITLLNDI